ncbi:MAG: flagellar protein FlaR [Planctomycetota bacterium]
MKRVAVLGNGGGGKSTLAQAVAAATGLPWHEVDPIQYAPGWVVVPEDEVRAKINAIIDGDQWIIDGFGPWDTIEARCARADTLIFIDHPIWVHFWWAAERQIAAALGEERLGGPDGCPLTTKTRDMFATLWRVHEELRPRLVELVDQHRGQRHVHHIQSPEELDQFLAGVAPR